MPAPCIIIYMPVSYMCIDIIIIESCTVYCSYLLFLYFTLSCDCFYIYLEHVRHRE